MLKNREKNSNEPTAWVRRHFFAGLLGIPPALLGLSGSASNQQEMPFTQREMDHYEGLLIMAWDMHYASNIAKSQEIITEARSELEAMRTRASGVKQDQIDYMLCRFNQTSSVISRDQGQMDNSLMWVNKAMLIADRLQIPLLIASSLVRRIRVYLDTGRYHEGYGDSQRIVLYADLCSDTLRCKSYQMAGEATSFIAGPDRLLQAKSLEYFKQALQIARSGDLTQDASFVKSDVTSILIEKADAQRMFGKFDDALETISIARDQVGPSNNRWHINLGLTEIPIYLDMGDIEAATSIWADVWPRVKDNNIVLKERELLSLYGRMNEQWPSHPALSPLRKLVEK